MAYRDPDQGIKLRAPSGTDPGGFVRLRTDDDPQAGMPVIYRKTAQGVSEIETRAHRLSPRLRGALIIVDGKRSDTELAALLPQAGESLAALAAQGFIEPVATSAAAPAVRPATPRAIVGIAAPPPAPAPAPAAPAAAADADFEGRRRAVLRAFNDLAGPAGETLAIKMEKARSLDDLRPLLPQAIRLVGMVQGSAAAEKFSTRLDEL
jgi:hypothetical protein